MAGDLLLSFDDYICENPQNKNVVIPNIKPGYGEVKTDSGWKKMTVTKCLDSITAKLLTDQRSDMELQVGGFNNNIPLNSLRLSICVPVVVVKWVN